MSEARPIVRLLVTLVLTLQAGLPAAAALADAPPSRSGHAEHVSSEGDAGCEPVHGALHCLLCRVLSSHPLAGRVAPAPGAAPPERQRSAPAVPALPSDGDSPPTRHARAPPPS